jgi:hypothetical protein
LQLPLHGVLEGTLIFIVKFVGAMPSSLAGPWGCEWDATAARVDTL